MNFKARIVFNDGTSAVDPGSRYERDSKCSTVSKLALPLFAEMKAGSGINMARKEEYLSEEEFEKVRHKEKKATCSCVRDLLLLALIQ